MSCIRESRAVRAAVLVLVVSFAGAVCRADEVYQPLPFSQDWSNVDLITVDDDWSGVPGIVAGRGEDMAMGLFDLEKMVDGETGSIAVDAQGAIPDEGEYNFFEVESLPNPSVVVSADLTDGPHLLLHLDTTGRQGVNISFTVTPFPVFPNQGLGYFVGTQYRVGDPDGDFTHFMTHMMPNVDEGPYFVCEKLPDAVEDEPQVDLRIILLQNISYEGSVAIDDIVVGGLCEVFSSGFETGTTAGWF